MSNFIAAWGPSGPMYLKKTEEANVYYVINGDWTLIPNVHDQNKYFIIKDNFINANYNEACDFIRKIYNEKLIYPILTDSHHSPYNLIDENENINDLRGVTDESRELPPMGFSLPTKEFFGGVTEEMLYNLPPDQFSNKSTTKGTNSPKIDVKNPEVYAIAEHFDIPLPLTEANKSVIKQLIAQGYKLPNKEKTMSPETNIVTVETVNLVNGVDVKELNANDLLNSVIQLEANIKKLKEIETPSEFVEMTILKQKDVLATVIKHLNEKG